MAMGEHAASRYSFARTCRCGVFARPIPLISGRQPRAGRPARRCRFLFSAPGFSAHKVGFSVVSFIAIERCAAPGQGKVSILPPSKNSIEHVDLFIREVGQCRYMPRLSATFLTYHLHDVRRDDAAMLTGRRAKLLPPPAMASFCRCRCKWPRIAASRLRHCRWGHRTRL